MVPVQKIDPNITGLLNKLDSLIAVQAANISAVDALNNEHLKLVKRMQGIISKDLKFFEENNIEDIVVEETHESSKGVNKTLKVAPEVEMFKTHLENYKMIVEMPQASSKEIQDLQSLVSIRETLVSSAKLDTVDRKGPFVDALAKTAGATAASAACVGAEKIGGIIVNRRYNDLVQNQIRNIK